MLLEDIYSQINKDLEQVRIEIKKQISFLAGNHKFINEIIGYFFDNPGKMIRPALVILSAKAINEPSCYEDMIMLCAIVEYIHSASLIHDDVVDESTNRREKPSLNICFGNKISVLAGDMLYAHALKLLTERFDKKIIKIFSKCVERMCRGEINELKEYNFNQYLRIIKDKTATFMAVCCKVGAMISLKNDNLKLVHALSNFGLNFGMIYQIIDDLMDNDSHITKYREKLVDKLNEFIYTAKENLLPLPNSIYKDSLSNLLHYFIEQNDAILINDKV